METKYRFCIDCGKRVSSGHTCDEGKAKTDYMINHLRRMGFTKGWEPSIRVNIYGLYVLEILPDISGDDWIYLCNQIGHIYSSNDFSCILDIRLCKDFNGEPTYDYAIECNAGKGKPFNKLLLNIKTGSKFWYGFNHGH